jgi:hypothetical protein
MGRYTQPDPLGLASLDANRYSYSHQSPIAASDPLGLFSIDPSCDCERQLPDNVSKGLSKARQWAGSPACSAALNQYPEVKSCVARRFSPSELGKEPVIRCHSQAPPEGDYCGSNTPQMITAPPAIHLYPGATTCPRYKPNIGIGATIFHETLHICGILTESEAAELTKKCTGFDARP